MSKLTIGKKEFEAKEVLLDQSELLFYEENPRVYSALRNDGTIPSQEDIELKMKDMEHVKQLRYSIEQNGGLIDPLIVVKRAGKYIVLEGNSRLAAYRLLSEKDAIKWCKVRVHLLPEDISEGEIFTLLGQYHLVGRKDWSIFEQAAYLYRQKESTNIETDILAKSVGLTESKVKSLIQVYEFMLEHDDLRPDRWSYYDEYLKNRGIRKYRETIEGIDEMFVNQVKTGEIKQAIDVRNKLGKLAKGSDKAAKKLMKAYINGTEDVYEAFEKYQATGKINDGYQRIKKFREQIVDYEFIKAVKSESIKNKDVEFELKKIKKAVDKLLDDINTQ